MDARRKRGWARGRPSGAGSWGRNLGSENSRHHACYWLAHFGRAMFPMTIHPSECVKSQALTPFIDPFYPFYLLFPQSSIL